MRMRFGVLTAVHNGELSRPRDAGALRFGAAASGLPCGFGAFDFVLSFMVGIQYGEGATVYEDGDDDVGFVCGGGGSYGVEGNEIERRRWWVVRFCLSIHLRLLQVITVACDSQEATGSH